MVHLEPDSVRVLEEERVVARRPGSLLGGVVSSPAASRISDDEMARINIEASAALAEWIDLHRTDPGRHALFGICLIQGTRGAC